MELRGKKVLVVGSGSSGIATTRFCLARGARVTLNDQREEIAAPQYLLERGLTLAPGGHDAETFLSHELIVLSPGVPAGIGPAAEARARGIEVISEVELAARFLRAPLIAVTGTNGKTTTTSLIGALLQAAGRRVFVGGNIGTPLIECCQQEEEARYDYAVAEISSFQLEAISSFRPAISVLLNITDDHFDRHGDFAGYRAAKARIFERQLAADLAVLSADDEAVASLAPSIRAEVLHFSQTGPVDAGAWHDGLFHFSRGGRRLDLDASGAALRGAHNIENMLAAGLVAFICGAPAEVIRETLVTFKGLPHRMELVGEIGGVRFFNDSKGTNVGAVVRSMESVSAPLILIAGGKDKGGSYGPLAGLLRSKGKALVLLGEARERIAAELGHAVPTVMTDSLDEAVAEAYRCAAPGDTVLFSPACASFDMFTSYAHRGRCFVESVHKLKGGHVQ